MDFSLSRRVAVLCRPILAAISRRDSTYSSPIYPAKRPGGRVSGVDCVEDATCLSGTLDLHRKYGRVRYGPRLFLAPDTHYILLGPIATGCGTGDFWSRYELCRRRYLYYLQRPEVM